MSDAQTPAGAGAGASGTASTVQRTSQVVVDSDDPVWKYCTIPDEKKKYHLKCNYCEKTYSGGITRIKYHLAAIPKSNVKKCLKVPSDVKKLVLELLLKKKDDKLQKTLEAERARAEVNLDHSEGEASDNDLVVLKSARAASASSSKGGPMDKFCKLTPEEVVAAKKGGISLSEKVQTKLSTQKKEERRDRACEYICQFFYDASIPHIAVTLPSFALMLTAIGDAGSDLRGPSAYEMSGPFLQKRKQKVLDSFKNHKHHWELTGCTVMTDAWTDKRGRGVMNLVVHSAYGVCFLDSVDCSANKKDGKYIFELVDKCIQEVGEKNVVQVVADNASVNWAAAAMLKAKRPSIFWNGCAAHSIDLMLEDIGKIAQVEQTIVKGRSVTTFLYAHTRLLALMRKFLGKDLVRAGITRFATAYLNLKSMQDNKKNLTRLFRSDEIDNLGYLKKDKGKKAAKVVRSETFWKNVEDAVNFFEPLANALRMMDSDIPAMGFLHGSLLDAKKELARRFDNDEERYKVVYDIIDKRWDYKLKSPLHLAGYYLNPFYYYRNKLEIELDGSFEEGLVTCVTKMIEDTKIQDKITDEVNAYRDQTGSFGKDIATRQLRNANFDPAKWWQNHGTSPPNLRNLARKILGLTCSSSACERNWSAFDQVHTKRRSRLLHDRMRDLVFVKFNSKLKHKKENKERDPIERIVVDIVEDEENEWITGVVPEDPVPEAAAAGEQVVASQGQRKRKRAGRHRKRTRNIIDIITEDKEDEPVTTSSSDSEDDHDVDMEQQPPSDHSSHSDFETSVE